MAKAANGTIRNAHIGAKILNSTGLDPELSLQVYDIVEALGPKARGIEQERQNLLASHGEGGLLHAQQAWNELMEKEQEMPDILPCIEISFATLRAANATMSGELLGAMRALGVLKIVADDAKVAKPAPGTRQAKRKAARGGVANDA